MIEIKDMEFEDNGVAKNIFYIYFLGIPLYKKITTTTNVSVVNTLKLKEVKKITGFKIENDENNN